MDFEKYWFGCRGPWANAKHIAKEAYYAALKSMEAYYAALKSIEAPASPGATSPPPTTPLPTSPGMCANCGWSVNGFSNGESPRCDTCIHGGAGDHFDPIIQRTPARPNGQAV